jgi:hypothetical protein
VINGDNIDLTALNAAVATSFTEATYTFIAPPPLIAGSSWKSWQFDQEIAARVLKSAKGKKAYEVAIGKLRFRGSLSSRKIAELRSCCNLVVVSRYENGLVKLDGLDWNEDDNKFELPTIKKMQLGDYEHTSQNTTDEYGVYDELEIVGTTRHAGYDVSFAFGLLV